MKSRNFIALSFTISLVFSCPLPTGNDNPSHPPITLPITPMVSTGLEHTLAIKADGSLWAWGTNTAGQLGIGSLTDSPTPVRIGAVGLPDYSYPTPTQIGTDSNWSAVTTSYDHTLTLKTDGTLWAWGNNAKGQLGVGTDTWSPQQIGFSIAP